MMMTVDSMFVGRRSLLTGSAALAGLWPLPYLGHAVRRGDGQQDTEWSAPEGVEVTRCGHIALIILNRPSQGNFLDKKIYSDLLAAFRTIGEDESILSTVLASRGMHFSKGIAPTPSQMGEMLANGLSTKPVVAALQGQIAGLGAALPLCADIRIASADAAFSWPDPDDADTLRARLVEEIGRANALRFLLTGYSLDAREAWRLGFVQDIVADPAEAFEKAMAIAEAIAQRAVEARSLA